MAKLSLCGEAGVAEITLEDATELKIVGGAVFAGEPVLAWHEKGAWHVGRHRFERITYEGWVLVELRGEQATRRFGPFHRFSLANDMAVSAEGILARYEPLEETWQVDRHASRCDTLVLKPVEVRAG